LHEYVSAFTDLDKWRDMYRANCSVTHVHETTLLVPDFQVAGALRISSSPCSHCTYFSVLNPYPGCHRLCCTAHLLFRFFSMYGLTLAFQGAVDREKAKKAAQRIFTLTDRRSRIDPLSDEGVIVSDDGTVDV
jgi:hypothetical protein